MHLFQYSTSQLLSYTDAYVRYIVIDYGLHKAKSKAERTVRNHLDLDRLPTTSHDCAQECPTPPAARALVSTFTSPCSFQHRPWHRRSPAARPTQSRYPSWKPYTLFRDGGGINTYTSVYYSTSGAWGAVLRRAVVRIGAMDNVAMDSRVG
jgi:hypothetical protein